MLTIEPQKLLTTFMAELAELRQDSKSRPTILASCGDQKTIQNHKNHKSYKSKNRRQKQYGKK